jgi:hypothetical protein
LANAPADLLLEALAHPPQLGSCFVR